MLESSEHRNMFELGQVDTFNVQTPSSLGQITKVGSPAATSAPGLASPLPHLRWDWARPQVVIGHDNTAKGEKSENHRAASWFLDSVTVYETTSRMLYRFPCCRWLSMCFGDRRIELEILETRQKHHDDIFRVRVVTGNVRMSGTDAAVHIELYGAAASSGEFQLVDSNMYTAPPRPAPPRPAPPRPATPHRVHSRR